MFLKRFIVSLSLVFLLILSSFADGFIIPHNNNNFIPIRKQNIMSVKYHKVKVFISNNNIAKVKIDQVFVNNTNRVIEGTYLFPLPRNFNILSFSMYINGKKVKGELLKKDKARQIYEDIVRKMKDPALLEYSGRNLFKLRIYPINPHEKKKITITYIQKVKKYDKFYRFVYPLDIEKYSYNPIEDVQVSVVIKNKNNAIRTVYSPYYKVDIQNKGNYAKVVYKSKYKKPDKDFVLYYSLDKQNIAFNYLTYKDNDGQNYFALFLSANPQQSKKDIINKDIIFVIDKSGSMSEDKKIVYAKKALNFILNHLTEGDRFNIISFSTDTNSLFNRLENVNSNTRLKGIDFVKNLEAIGGTDIQSSLLKALSYFKEDKRPKYIVFLTDGLPTVGNVNIKSIIKNVTKKNKLKVRFFIFGVGYNVNTSLLDNLAKHNYGYVDYFDKGKDIEISLSNFYKKIAYPVLTDIKIKFKGVKVYGVLPKIIPDVFVNSQLQIVGKFKDGRKMNIILTGKKADKKIIYRYHINLDSKEENSFLPKLWASKRIGYLLNIINTSGENKEIVDEIIKLSKKYGIITPYTSFLITEDSHSLSREEAASRFYESMPKKKVGKGAVYRSKMSNQLLNAQQWVSSAPMADKETKQKIYSSVKYVANKTFFLRKGVWTESSYNKEKTIKIKYLSKEYFLFINKHKTLAKVFALGSKVIFRLNNKWYEIVDK